MSCGAGVRTRVVSCTGVANKCDPESKPVSVIQCSLASCPVWQTGRWSEVLDSTVWDYEGKFEPGYQLILTGDIVENPFIRQGGRPALE